MQDPPQLTAFQIQVARTFFSLPASEGFLIAGGAALAAHALTTRPTKDVDLFTADPPAVLPALAALEGIAAEHGWTIDRQYVSDTFCRITVRGPEDVSVDLALDAPPGMTPAMTMLGPTYAPEELAGQKVVALFSRAEPRDLTDVYDLAQRFSLATLLESAAAVDPGFDPNVLATMIRGRLARVDDIDLPTSVPQALRDFYAQWLIELSASAPDAPCR